MPQLCASAFGFGASGEPTIEAASVFSSTIVSTFVTGAGVAVAVPQAACSARVGGAGSAVADACPTGRSSDNTSSSGFTTPSP